VSDREPEEWAVWADRVLYATRPTRAEAEQVVAEQRHLIERFGLPIRVEPHVIPLAGGASPDAVIRSQRERPRGRARNAR
jgi:hypothetical protein